MFELCVAVHRGAIGATDAPTTSLLLQQVGGPFWAADFSGRHYVGGIYPKLLPPHIQILHVACTRRLTCFAQ